MSVGVRILTTETVYLGERAMTTTDHRPFMSSVATRAKSAVGWTQSDKPTYHGILAEAVLRKGRSSTPTSIAVTTRSRKTTRRSITASMSGHRMMMTMACAKSTAIVAKERAQRSARPCDHFAAYIKLILSCSPGSSQVAMLGSSDLCWAATQVRLNSNGV